MKGIVMAWVAVDYDGAEWIYRVKPFRGETRFKTNSECVELPKDSIVKLIRKELSWKDEPIELKKN